MPKGTDSNVRADGEGTMVGDEADAEAAAEDSVVDVYRLAARLAGLELDAGTLEMVMAALTADVCDHIDAPDA
jgi:hypothetical protein